MCRRNILATIRGIEWYSNKYNIPSGILQWGGDRDFSELYPPTSKPQSSSLAASISLSAAFLAALQSFSGSSSTGSFPSRGVFSALGPLQILRWRVRWYLVRKALWHFSQTKSLRPSWEFMCFFKWLVLRKFLLHLGHWICRSLGEQSTQMEAHQDDKKTTTILSAKHAILLSVGEHVLLQVLFPDEGPVAEVTLELFSSGVDEHVWSHVRFLSEQLFANSTPVVFLTCKTEKEQPVLKVTRTNQTGPLQNRSS